MHGTIYKIRLIKNAQGKKYSLEIDDERMDRLVLLTHANSFIEILSKLITELKEKEEEYLSQGE